MIDGKLVSTRGPLVARQSEQGHWEVLAPSAGKTRHRVARLGGPDRHANAVLFAASLDMLEALKGAREVMGANAARDAVDAAIARAEGRHP